jgi:hypothetical protein
MALKILFLYLFLDSTGTAGPGPGEAAPTARRRAYMVQGKD